MAIERAVFAAVPYRRRPSGSGRASGASKRCRRRSLPERMRREL